MRRAQINRRLAAFLVPVVGLFTVSCPALAERARSTEQTGAQTQNFADGIAAVVNRKVITLQQVDTEAKAVRKQLAFQKIEIPDQETLRRQVLQRMITEELIRQEAARMRITVTDQQLEEAVSTIAQRNKMSVSRLRAEIEKSGSSWAYYMQTLRQEILTDEVRRRAVDSRIMISDAEVDAFLRAQGRSTSVPGGNRAGAAQQTVSSELGLAQILVRIPEGASSRQIQDLRAKAQELLARVRGGADFASVAAASSDGPEALEGGSLGVRPADGWPDLFLSAVKSLPAGAVSDIVQSGNGFHILKVTTRGAEARQQAQSAPSAPSQQNAFGQEGPMMVTQTRARHILVKIDQAMTQDRALARARNLRERVTMGEDFAEVARRASEDASAPEGGDLGWLTPGETVPAFQQAMDALSPGEVSQPVLSPFGWHIIKVEERRTQNMEEEFKRMRARQMLFERQAGPAFEDWLGQIRGGAYIDNRLMPRQNNNRLHR